MFVLFVCSHSGGREGGSRDENLKLTRGNFRCRLDRHSTGREHRKGRLFLPLVEPFRLHMLPPSLVDRNVAAVFPRDAEIPRGNRQQRPDVGRFDENVLGEQRRTAERVYSE